MPATRMKVKTPRCIVCGKVGWVTMPADAYDAWAAGAMLQTAAPGLSVDDREQLLSGTHPACWDTLDG